MFADELSHCAGRSSAELQVPCQRDRVVWRTHLGIVVEIDVDVTRRPACGWLWPDKDRVFRHAPGRPRRDAMRPAGERRRAIAAGIEFLRAMQAQIEEVGGDVLAIWIFHGNGRDEGDTL